MGSGFRLSRSDLLPVGSCGRLCICFIRFSAVFRPVFLVLGDSFATTAALRWTGVSFPRMEDGQLCDGPRVFGLCAHGAVVDSDKVYLEYTPSMFALCLFFFAVTLLMRYGTWIPNSILASVQLGAAVSSGVPQTGLLPVGSRGRVKLRYSTSAAIFHSGLRSYYAQSSVHGYNCLDHWAGSGLIQVSG